MMDKLKMWLMTEENKQKYLMEKEKAERDSKRREKDDVPAKKEKVEKESKSNAKDKGKDKNKGKDTKPSAEERPKKQNGLFGKKSPKTDIEEVIVENDENLNNEEVEEAVEEKPKKVVVIKRKTDTAEKDNTTETIDNTKEYSTEKNPFDDIDSSYFNKNNTEDINEIEEDNEVKDEEDLNFDVISDLYKKSEEIQSEKRTNNTSFMSDEEEDRKVELLNKKKEEEDKYMTILLDLPPTTDEAYFIRRAFEAGIPEWFLRSKGYIVDSIDTIKEEKVKPEILSAELSVEKLAVQKLKEEFKSVVSEDIEVDDILDDVMEELLENESELIEDEVLDEITKIEEKTDSEDLFVVDLSVIDESDSFVTSQVEESEVKTNNVMKDLINEELKALEKNKEEELKKNSSVIISELRNRMKTKKLEEENKDVTVNNKVLKPISEIAKEVKPVESLSPAIDISELKLKARQAIKAAVKESVNVKVESDTETQALLNVEERLKSLKRKREVLSSNGNNILVKEDIEIGEGKVVTNYKSYNVSEEDKVKIEVGKEIDESEVLLNESEVLIDGEVYNLTKEEELELIKKYSKREIWVLSEDNYLLEKYKTNLENSRYIVNLIKSEKDFIMAIRSVDNLIIFTKDIPKAVEKSVAGFIKYLKSEQRKARLATIEESKVNSKILEYSFEDLSIESLDNYYTEFDLSLYREIRKPISELYKQISFDLTSELMENDTIEISLDEIDNSKHGDISLDIDSSRVLVGINKDNNGDVKSKQGDFELKLDDTIVINLDDLK